MSRNEVRYRQGASNVVLREALLRVWGDRCYWCKGSATFRDVEIDHIVPKDLKGEALDQALTDLGRPVGFDLHDPANLAPIHPVCNGEKLASFQAQAPRFIRSLDLAASYRERVVSIVGSFKLMRGLETALVTLQAANLADPDAREAVTTVVSSLSRALWPERYGRNVRVRLDHDIDPVVQVPLNSGATSSAVNLLDALFGTAALTAIVEDLVRQTWQDTYEEVRQHFDGLDIGGIEQVQASAPTPTSRAWHIEAVSFDRDDREFTFDLEGSIVADFTVSLAVASTDGGELEDGHQGDAYVETPFSWRVALSDTGTELALVDYELPGLGDTLYLTSLDERMERYADMVYEAWHATEEGDETNSVS